MKTYAHALAGMALMVMVDVAIAGPQEDRNIQLIRDYYAAYATGNPEQSGRIWLRTSYGEFPVIIHWQAKSAAGMR